MSSLISYYSLVSYDVGIPGETYNIPFPYLFQSDIYLYINGEEVPAIGNITWTSDSTVTVANTSVDDEIYFRRYTLRESSWVSYSNAGTLGEEAMNFANLQLLYLIQELWDAGLAGTTENAPPGSNGNPGQGGNTLPQLIDDIINELLQTQLFQDLVTLIDLTDINAEAVIQNALQIHNNWTINQQLDLAVENHTIDLANIGVNLGVIDAQIIDLETTQTSNYQTLATTIDGVATRLGDAEANVVVLQTAVSDLDSSTALQITQLQATIADNEALILTVETAVADLDTALASRIDLLEVDIQTADAALEARIGTIETSYVDENEASAIAITEISTKFAAHDWEGQFSSSSYISGIEAISDQNQSSLSGINSFLVGIGGDYNTPESWQPGSQAFALAGVQTTVNAQASLINASSDFRTAMFAYFYPGGSVNNPADQQPMIAAMEDTWRLYADSESLTAQRIQTVELNNQPMFFRATAPDPSDPEFAAMPWAPDGFPEDSTWYKQTSDLSHRIYRWQNSGTTPPGAVVVSFPGITGRWVETADDEQIAQGVEITQLTNAYNNLQLVGGSVVTTIQAVVGNDIAAIEETLEAYVDTENGLLYSTWNVRMNQYNAGVPVIAGVGLGMQQDPDNPEAGSRSDFVVMADYFSIIKPPSGADIINGVWDSETVFVPFIVNTGNVPGEPDVIVNGDMFVKNSLSAMDGMAGRFTFTELDGFGYPTVRDGNYNATGDRLVLCSSTNGYNIGVGASPFVGGSNPQKFWLWAGTGTMSHNNAVFYVDTDGNAYFGGSVSAQNITGDVGNATAIAVNTATVTVPNGSTAWHQVGGDVISDLPGVPRSRKASATVAVAMFGSGAKAGRARLSIARETGHNTGTWGSWVNVSEYPIEINLGTSLTLSGTHPTEGLGRFKVKVEISREPANGGGFGYPSSNRYDGNLLLLS